MSLKEKKDLTEVILRIIESDREDEFPMLSQQILKKRSIDHLFSIDFFISELNEQSLSPMMERFDEDKTKVAQDLIRAMMHYEQEAKKEENKVG